MKNRAIDGCWRAWSKGLLGACLAVLASACAAPGSGRSPGSGTFYRCEYGIEFSVRFVDDSAVLDGSRGYDVVYRPAGTMARLFSNARMSAEFGLGSSGREALLKYPLLPLAARCVQD